MGGVGDVGGVGGVGDVGDVGDAGGAGGSGKWLLGLLGLVGLAALGASLAGCGGDDDGGGKGGGGSTGSAGSGGGGAPPSLSCEVAGPVVPSHWGPASGAATTIACFEITSDRDVARPGEVAFSAVPIARGFALADTSGLAVVGPGGVRVPAQLDVLSRWGGPLADTSLPIRWLQVSVPTDLGANGSARYALAHIDGLAAPPPDATAARVREEGGKHVVDTGVARFTLDAKRPGLFDKIELFADASGADPVTVYEHAPGDGMGPRLVLDGGATLDAQSISLDKGAELEVVESGPVKVVVAQRGHFVGAGTACTKGDAAPYEALGYTLVLTLSRGQRHVDLDFNFRNECTTNYDPPWTDDDVTVDGVSFELPLSLAGTLTGYWAGSGAVETAPSPQGALVVEQQKGGGSPWTRRARVRLGTADLDAAEAFDAPFVAVGNGAVLASAAIPWMRYREPQAVAATGATLSVRFVSEKTIVGEARGIWNLARIGLDRTPESADPETVRTRSLAALERGLLVRPTVASLNAAAVYPALGTGAEPTPLLAKYVELMALLHEDTVERQWARTKTYGSQVWPDQPLVVSAAADSPALNGVEMNYWAPTRNELLEFWRTGDPRWAWDWAIQGEWYQIHSAYSNAGEHGHGNRNGFALISGGCGWSNGCCHLADPPLPADVCPVAGEDPEGHWNRSNFGSDDYTYTHGDIAYVLRPSFPLVRRFAQAGRNAIERYVDDAASRGLWVSNRDISRQVIQHMMMLAGCAEFVPGSEGKACHDKLVGILDELATENLTAGVMCERDDVDSTYLAGTTEPTAANPRICIVPQQFMQNALMLPFFYRMLLNYGDRGGPLARTVTESIFQYYAHGMALPTDERPTGIDDAARPAIVTTAEAPWTNQLQYTLSADRNTVEACPDAPVGELISYDDTAAATAPAPCRLSPLTDPLAVGEDAMILENRPQTVGWLVVAHTFEPKLRVCEVGKKALGDPAFVDLLDGQIVPEGGWYKGPSQYMQGLAFALGAIEICKD
jgi:hypothetical protein